jgi:CHAT domain-containing protein
MKILFSLFFSCFFIFSKAQILNRLKDRAIQKTRKNTIDKAKSEGWNTYHKEIDDIRAEFDSTDFDYAILLSDNSGLFNVKDKREAGGKFMNLKKIGNQLYRQDIDVSDEEKGKLNLSMGESAYATGHWIFAEKKFHEAIRNFEHGGLTNHPYYFKSISNLGLLLGTMGRYRMAERYTQQALQLQRQASQGSMDVGASLNNYGVLHYNLGQYNEAENKILQSLNVIEKNKMQASLQYAVAINNRGVLYQALGRYDDAEKDLKNAIAIRMALGTKAKNGSLIHFQSNLALLYQQMGRFPDAEKIYQRLQKNIGNQQSEAYANMLDNLAILYLVMHQDDKVEPMLTQSAGIYKNVFTENSPAYAKVISDLGNFYRYKGRYDEARPLLQQALNIRQESYGFNHPLFVQSQEDLAILYWKQNNYTEAYPLYQSVMEKSLDFINRYFPPMSDAEKTKYWNLLSPRFERFYNFALEAIPSNRNAVTDLLQYRFATKGLLLSSQRKITQTILNSGNQDLIKDYNDWLDQKEELARMFVFSKQDLQDQGINLDSMMNAVNTLEKKLSVNSKDFAQFYFTSKTDIHGLQSAMKNDEALLEIIRLRRFNQVLSDSCRYLALILTKTNPDPLLTILDDGNSLETKNFKSYRLSMQNKIPDEKSYTFFWQPFESNFKGKKKIYVSLDGVYNQVNLNTLKKPGSDYLLNQYDIVLIGNGKDIVTLNKFNSAPTKNATLIGDPDYSADTNLQPLPATKTEVDGINKVLKTSGYSVSEFVLQDANENNLRAVRQVSILHIATHGFFFPDVEHPSWPIGISPDNARDNVLLRSGLVLTGVQENNKLNPTMDSATNGVITSYEAMNLDLKGTKLVVLSACETGLGEIKAGEGVYGLQRAFIAAGADAIIMSLWKVDDAATQQLMNNFYGNWLKSNDRQKAFKLAQQQLMTKYKEPYYWGAFVMMED